jgi:hypothetical protein
VVAVHDSRESWERHRDETLLPALASIDNGYPSPPEEMTFDVQVFQTRERKG